MFTRLGNPTSVFTQARQQLRNYLRYAVQEKDYLGRHGFPNINLDNVRSLLVIGKKANLTTETQLKLDNINGEVRSRYEIKTFDQILDENRTLLNNIRGG